MSKAKPRSAAKAKNAAAVAGTTSAPGTSLALARPMPQGIVLKRRITLPVLVMKTLGEVRYLAIADAVRESKVPGKVNKEGVQEKPASICTVGDVETGEVFTFMVPAVIKSVFTQEYEGTDYVGRCFMIENLGKRAGKRHVDFAVAEVDASALTAQAGA